MKAFTVLATLAAAATVSAHGVVIGVKGANGKQGTGFGTDPSTPRDSPSAGEPQQDTSIIRDSEIESGEVGGCGRTKLNGNVDIAAEMQKATAAGMPTIASDGTVTATLHQINQDGAGPFTMDVDPTGTGQSFQQMEVVSNVPGADIPFVGSLSTATVEDFQLVGKMPAGVTCTGGDGQACLFRARNSAIAGPFGSCFAAAQDGSAPAASSSGTSSTTSSSTGSTGSTTGSTTGTDSSSTTSSSSDSSSNGGGAGGFLSSLLGGNKRMVKARRAPVEDITSLDDIEAALSQVEERMLRSRVARLLARELTGKSKL